MKPTAIVVCLLASVACVDFGIDVDPSVDAGLVLDSPEGVVDAGDVQGDAGSSETCVDGPTEPSATGPQLEYRSLSVDQPLLVLQHGDVVTWTNGDTMRHSVVAGAPGAETPPARGGFNSGELAPGSKFAVRFCTPKTQVYFCSTHPSQMNGYRLVVQ